MFLLRCVTLSPPVCCQGPGSRSRNQSEHLWHGRASILLWGEFLTGALPFFPCWTVMVSLIFAFQVRNEFYKDSQGVLLVYDVGLRESFDALDSWLGEMKQEMGSQANMESIVFIVCANKVRLGSGDGVRPSRHQGETNPTKAVSSSSDFSYSRTVACPHRLTWQSGAWSMRGRGACGRSPGAFITLKHRRRAAKASMKCFRCVSGCNPCKHPLTQTLSMFLGPLVLFFIHHRHVWERREAPGDRGQRGLHQRAGRHHSTHPQQQRLLGHAWREAGRHTVSWGQRSGSRGSSCFRWH